MALSILDGNQSATTLSTILSSGQHITAHTVISLGTQAITDIVNATSAGLTNTQLRASAVTVGGTVTVGNSVTVSSLPAISGTVTANAGANVATAFYDGIAKWASNQGGDGSAPIYVNVGNPISGAVTIGSALPAGTNRIGVVTIGAGTVTIGAGTAQIGSVTVGNSVTISSLPAISGTVTANGGNFTQAIFDGLLEFCNESSAPLPVNVQNSILLNAGTNRIGVVTIGAGTVTIGAGTSQIGSVTASISNFPATQPVSLTTLPALVAGTAQIGSVTASISSLPAISGTVTANLSISSTAITSGSFTSLTSATLVPANTARKMATVYNLGAGQLFVNAGVTATTLGGGFMVALSSGDFYECGYTTTTLSAIFATAGTASWVSH